MITKKQLLVVASAFSALMYGGVYWTQLSSKIQSNEHDRLLSDIAIAQASALERRISHSLSATYILAQEVKRSSGRFENFENYAEEVLKSIGGISNLQLAPDGIISKIHPLTGQEKALGHNILRDDRRRNEAQLAVRQKQLTLAGPFTLIQGGEAIIGRNPVFIDKDGVNEFWGFTSALIYLDDVISATDLSNLESKGYSYQLTRTQPDTGETNVFARSKSDLRHKHTQSRVITVPNATWVFHLSDAPRTTQNTGYFASFFGALMLASFLYKILAQPETLRQAIEEKTAQLKELAFHDQLTGLANRRLLHEHLKHEIERLLRTKEQAALLYIDLDDFKRINDSMGREAGDLLLQSVADRLRNSVRKNDIVARLGGDEFAVLLLNPATADKARVTAEKLLRLVQQPIALRVPRDYCFGHRRNYYRAW